MITKNMVCQELQTNRHEVAVDTKDTKKTFEQIVLWGEASWWPNNCLMKFIRLENSPIQKGALYRQKVLLPFAPSWCAVVSDAVENRSISRKFLDGFLDGEETVSIGPFQDKLKVEYLMNYKIKGFVNKILWKLCFNRLHDRNIKLILGSLKDYLER